MNLFTILNDMLGLVPNRKRHGPSPANSRADEVIERRRKNWDGWGLPPLRSRAQWLPPLRKGGGQKMSIKDVKRHNNCAASMGRHHKMIPITAEFCYDVPARG